jgi:ketosteroid isomerase-like protein
MAHPNVEVIRKGYDAFMRGDMETARSIFQPTVVWHVPGRGPLSGNFRGFDEIARWGGQLFERSKGTFREDLVDIVADDKWAMQVTTYQAERNSRHIHDQSVNVYRMVDGLVAECWVYFGDPKGFEEFWA